MDWVGIWDTAINVVRVATVFLSAFFAARMTKMAIPVFKAADEGVEVSKWMYAMLVVYSFNVFLNYSWDLVDNPINSRTSIVVIGHMIAFIIGIRMLNLSQAAQDRIRKDKESTLTNTGNTEDETVL